MGRTWREQYSKFDGFASIKSIVGNAKKMGMPAVGLTDHGTFAGAIDFLRECRNQGIRPVLGMESYLARDHQCHAKEGQPDGRKGNRHIILIAKNYTGFKNLCALSQTASLDGYYYDPRIDFELLAKHREGLIVTTACLSNIVNFNLLCDQYDKAKRAASMFKEVFGDDFYLEMMYHGLDSEAKVLPQIQRLSQELGIKTIVTNDNHYNTSDEAKYHEIIMCISSNKVMKDPSRLRFPYGEFYFKSQQEMAKIFGHLPQSMRNTLDIAEKCDYSEIIFVEDGGSMLLPKFDLPQGYKNPYQYLHDLAWKGMKRLGLDNSQPHIERLNRELGDIKLIWDTKRYDFATYFLIVWDIMKFAAERQIAAGVRGSGFASLLLRCLGIVEGQLDPIKYKLLWERFLGFDSVFFLSEEDFGIKAESASQEFEQTDEDESLFEEDEEGTEEEDASSVMHDRYH